MKEVRLAPFLPQLSSMLLPCSHNSSASLESHFSRVPNPSSSVTRGLSGAVHTQKLAPLPSRHFHRLSIMLRGRERFEEAARFTIRVLLVTRAFVSVIFQGSLVYNQSSQRRYCVGGPHFLPIKHPQMFTDPYTLCPLPASFTFQPHCPLPWLRSPACPTLRLANQ